MKKINSAIYVFSLTIVFFIGIAIFSSNLDFDERNTVLMTVFTGLLTLLTGILAYYTYSLVRDSKEASITTLRPYVSSSPNFIHFLPKQPNDAFAKPQVIKAEILNHGQTPAYFVRTSGVFDILPLPLPEHFSFPNIPVRAKGSLILFPQQALVTAIAPNRIFTDEEINDASINKGKAFYIYGITEYETFWGRTHFTKFCRFAQGSSGLNALALGSQGNENFNYGLNPIHNDAN